MDVCGRTDESIFGSRSVCSSQKQDKLATKPVESDGSMDLQPTLHCKIMVEMSVKGQIIITMTQPVSPQ